MYRPAKNYRPGVTQKVGRGIALLFHDRGNRRGEWSAARPGRTLPPGKTRYPFYRRLSGPQGRSWRAENLVPTGIRSRTVFSRYTDWATGPTHIAPNPSYSLAQSVTILTNLSVVCTYGHSILIRLSYRPDRHLFKFFYVVPNSIKMAPYKLGW